METTPIVRTSGPKRRRVFYIVAGILALFLLVLLGYRDEQAIDISSGRLRHRRQVLFFVVRENIVDTEFSTSIRRRHAVEAPHWRTVSSHSVFQAVSPYYIYGTAPSAIDNVVYSCRFRKLSDAETNAVLDKVFATLSHGNPRDLSEYAIDIPPEGQ